MFELPLSRTQMYIMKSIYFEDGKALAQGLDAKKTMAEIVYILWPYHDRLCCEQLMFLNSSHYSEMDYCLACE